MKQLREVNVSSKLEGMSVFFNKTSGEVNAICSKIINTYMRLRFILPSSVFIS